MIWDLIHIVDILLWLFTAGSVMYVFFFALVSLFHRKRPKELLPVTKFCRFLILYPAYNEDKVIKTSIENILSQTYSKDHYDVAVISDHMAEATNAWLTTQPVTLLTPTFENSSKAKAMQYAIERIKEDYDYTVILDADNIVESDFLDRLNQVCQLGCRAIQCHRCAKNANNDISVLDGISEEINNTIFRKAHNYIGLSSALIGSGMCFNYRWFRDNVHLLSTAGEDRELEVLLIEQNIYVHYEESIPVYDEKVSNADNFQRQRLRWMTAQIQCLLKMLPYTWTAMKEKNINFIDKTIQQALIPRSILIILTFVMTILMQTCVHAWGMKWLILLLLMCLSLILSIPPSMRRQSILRNMTMLPALVWRMILNLRKIKHKSRKFIHTEHEGRT